MNRIKHATAQVGLFAASHPYLVTLLLSLVTTAVSALLLGSAQGPLAIADPASGGTGGV